MPHAASGWWKWLVMALFVVCPLLAHFILLNQDTALLRSLLLLLPFAALACWVVLCASNKPLGLTAVALVAGAVYAIEQHSHAGIMISSGLPHTAAYVFLLWLFGRTLLYGREPLITRLARRVHGSLAPNMERYTRNVTAAWCVFSAMQLMVSAILLMFSTLETWSLFVNILNAPLIALMFLCEYIYRIVRFPGHPHVSIVQSWREFAKDASATTTQKSAESQS